MYKDFDTKYMFKMIRYEYLFLWCLFLAIQWIQKRVRRNDKNFLPWTFMRASPVMYKTFDTKYMFKMIRYEYLFLWCLFLAIQWIQKRVRRNDKNFLPWTFMRASLCLFLAIKWFQKRVHRNDKKILPCTFMGASQVVPLSTTTTTHFFSPSPHWVKPIRILFKIARIRGGEKGLGKF